MRLASNLHCSSTTTTNNLRYPHLTATMMALSLYPCLFLAAFLLRYVRAIVGMITWVTYKPKPISEKPQFRANDVTVVVPATFKTPGELVQCLRCILNCNPAAVFVITANANVDLVRTCCALNSFKSVQVLGVTKLNKRIQMLRALEQVETAITVFADDDVFWPNGYLDHLLAIFENPTVGAGGTRQRVRRSDKPSLWNFLGICYLERRVWNNVTTNAIDGSISTLSGRTAAYRTQILKNSEFVHTFSTGSWLGRPIAGDDDKALTMFLYAHGWNIALQFAPESILETTLEDGPKYIHQCLRWARGHWRGNFTVMTNQTYWRSPRYWFGLYAIYFGQFQSPALVVDSLLFYLLCKAFASSPDYKIFASVCLGIWILFTKTVKLIPHFCRHPADLKFLPAMLAFSYLHGIINIYALFTLHHTHWGSQNLEVLEGARAQGEEVVPLLRVTMNESDSYREPTPGEQAIELLRVRTPY